MPINIINSEEHISAHLTSLKLGCVLKSMVSYNGCQPGKQSSSPGEDVCLAVTSEALTTWNDLKLIFCLTFLEHLLFFSCSWPTLCDSMDCSMPGFPILHYLLEFAQTHTIELVMPFNHLLLPSIFPSIWVFSNELALHIRWPKYWNISRTYLRVLLHEDRLVVQILRIIFSPST